MQTLLNRAGRILDPFYCQFSVSSPVQPPPPPRDPLCGLPLELWLDIFQLATYVPRSTTIKPLNPFATKRASTRNTINTVNTPALALQTKLALVTVCKTWRCLALPVLYQHVVVRSPRRANLILRTLEESQLSERPQGLQHNLGHGQWVRHVEVFTHSRGCTSLKYLQTVFAVFRRSPNLRTLSGTWNHPVPPAFLDAVATLYGPSLEELYWNETTDKLDRQQYRFPTSATLDFLAAFKSLTTLDLRHFKLKDGFLENTELAKRPILPSVRTLIISTNPWSVVTANCLLLPRLRSLTVRTGSRIPEVVCNCHLNQLVQLHGHSLESVDILPPIPDESGRTAQRIPPAAFLQPDACPNLTSISFPPCSSPLLEVGHPSLRRIGLRGAKSETLYPDRAGDAKEHLNAILSSGRFPGLELVQTIGFYVETETDCLITDVFIWWTEQFANEGVNLLDGEGVLWEYEAADPTLEVEKAEVELKERERVISTSSSSGGKSLALVEGKKREAVKKQKIDEIDTPSSLPG